MKRITLILLAAGLLAPSAPVNALDLSVQAELGKCTSDAYMIMCAENRNVWRVSVQETHALALGLYATGTLIHFSSWDGAADLQGDVDAQSGAFDFAGVGVEITPASWLTIGAQYGKGRDSVDGIDSRIGHVYLKAHHELSDRWSITGNVESFERFGYVGAGLEYRF